MTKYNQSAQKTIEAIIKKYEKAAGEGIKSAAKSRRSNGSKLRKAM